MPNRVWFVTGCSSGFGEVFIKEILKRGDHAIATARRIDSIKHLADLGAKTLQLDVTATPAVLKTKVDEAVAFYGRIDVFIANAGVGQYSPVEELSPDLILHHFATNVFGTIYLTQALMPHWRAARSGYLIVNSSIMSWSVSPGVPCYPASKAALDRFVSSFAAETKDLGYIRTLILNPGYFRTQLLDPAKHVFPEDSKHYHELAGAVKAGLPQISGNQPGDPQKLVDVVLDIVQGEGVAKGREIPAFLPLGKDAFDSAKAYAEEMLGVLKSWEDVIKSTDFAA